MSIIHEALKKAASIKKANQATNLEKENQVIVPDNEAALIGLDTQPAIEQAAPKIQSLKNKNTVVTFVGVALILILAITAIYLLNNYFIFKKPLSKIPQIKIASVNNTAITQTSQPQKQPLLAIDKLAQSIKPPGTFTLSGIVFSDDEYVAIINGSIYSKGDYVGEAKIVDINDEMVLLKKEDKEIKLKLK